MYSQTMAARFDCKKLLRFALATLCLLALAMLMPVAARAEENTEALQETKKWIAEKDNTTYATFERNGEATETNRKQGRVTIEVYVMKPGKAAYSDESSVEGTDYDKYTKSEFYYQYNANVDDGLAFDANSKTFSKLTPTDNDKKGNGKGGYGSLDLKVTAGTGYTIYRVDYSVCYSSGGPTKTGWKTKDFIETENVKGPTPYCYLDNIQDNTTARVYLMPAYTVQYKVVDKDGNIADASTYSVATGSLNDATGVLPYAVAPTATPTATPAPTAEPTATPAPAAVPAHIPQTSDDMPYTLLVVTALASLCAAGALFMKRRSK